MTPSPFVPVEGALARPRVAPLDHVPPFGREWTFRGAPGARPGKHCLATLTTSCIDVNRPHRACRWQPRPVAASMPISAGTPVVPAAVAGTRIRRTVRRSRDRRAMYAVCWSIGAFGVIGWLIAAHEPPTGFGPAHTIQIADVAPDHTTLSTGTLRIAAVQSGTSTNTSPQRTVATPVAETAESPAAAHPAAPRPASPQPGATFGVQRTATASPLQTNGSRTTAAPHRSPTVPRLAARPPAPSDAANTHTRDRLAPPPHATDTYDARDTLDDPVTLIAMANALRVAQPARATHAPAAGFDWTSQLSHRRVTDIPDAFAR
ncbi:hypothetical protein [Burkholderia sp. BCC0322]|uniref:hypothetical protein n=1 Tax=unclassified Burkholderia TaxID=2613784 RepID=UPI00158ACAAB|nr:hypothetical protein [Burkholderia sp. BCC0322]